MEKQFDREFNINFQAKLLTERQEPLIDFNSYNENVMDTSSDYLEVSLSRENIIDIHWLAANPLKTIAGKFLLCRTITRATERHGIETIVEDPSGKLALQLQLHYYSTLSPCGETCLEHVLPTGFFLAVKNPTLIKSMASNKFVLQVIYPSQVELLSQKSLEQIVPGLEWKGAIPNVLPHGLRQNDFWKTIPNGETEAEAHSFVFQGLKKLGNIAFLDKRFSDAVRFYTLSLDYSAADDFHRSQILSNLSAAFLNLRCYRRALESSAESLKITPDDVKAIFRHAKALIGLQKYELASSFIKRKQSEYPEIQTCKAIKDTLQSLSKFLDNLSQPVGKNIDTRDNSDRVRFEYTGPLKITFISEEKGRGLIASKDIKAGQLIASCRAFSYYCLPTRKPEDLAETERIVKSSKFSLPKFKQNHQALLMNKLYLEPEEFLSGEFCNLFAGNSTKIKIDQNKSPPIPVEMILRILTHNAFGITEADMENWELSKSDISEGIWITASFANHSCSDFNAYCASEGDFNDIRAVKDIQCGDEILIAYIQPEVTYRERASYLRDTYGFECTCSLCALDKHEETTRPEVIQLRMKCLNKLRRLTESLIPNSSGLKLAQSVVAKLAKIRKEEPRLNFYLANQIVENYATRLFVIGHYEEARELCERIRRIFKDSGRIIPVCRLDALSLQCLIAMKDKTNVKKAVEVLKEDNILAFGSTDLVELYCKDNMEELKELGINSF